MTPWSEGRNTVNSFLVVMGGGAVLWAVACLLLIPGGGGLSGWLAGSKQSLAYAGAWGRFMADGGSLSVMFKQAEWAPLVMAAACVVGGLSFAIGATVVIAAKGRPSLYGQARWARSADIGRMALRGQLGPILGKAFGKYLVAEKPRHTLVAASTRSGKSAGIVIPTLLSYQGSMLVTDPKGELASLTGRALRKLGPVRVIRFSDPDSPDAWNPMDAALLPEDAISLERHCERIAAAFNPFQDTAGTEAHFQKTAYRNCASLLLFLALEARRNDRECHPRQIFELLADFQLRTLGRADDTDTDGLALALARVAATAEAHGYPERISQDMTVFAETPSRERGSHLSTLLTNLQLWRSAAVQGATRACTFSWDDLRRQRQTVFIQYPASDAEAYGPLTALFFDQFFAWAVDTAPEEKEWPIQVIADEFASLPRMAMLDGFLEKGAGMGRTIMFVVQDLAGLWKRYKKDAADALLTNVDFFVIFAQNNLETQRWLTGQVGQKSIWKATKNAKMFSDKGGGSKSETGVDLVPASAWGDIPFGKHVVLVKGHKTRPVMAKTPLWFEDRRFKRMVG